MDWYEYEHEYDINTELKGKAKSDIEKDFFKLMNNSVFGKAMKNLKTQKDQIRGNWKKTNFLPVWTKLSTTK